MPREAASGLGYVTTNRARWVARTTLKALHRLVGDASSRGGGHRQDAYRDGGSQSRSAATNHAARITPEDPVERLAVIIEERPFLPAADRHSSLGRP
jgi:hypothetical protein